MRARILPCSLVHLRRCPSGVPRRTEKLIPTVPQQFSCSLPDPRVRPTARGRPFRLFAATKRHAFLLFTVTLHRREFRPRMRSIAKRLVVIARSDTRECPGPLRQWRVFGAPSLDYPEPDSSIMHSLEVHVEASKRSPRKRVVRLTAFSTSPREPLRTDRCQP